MTHKLTLANYHKCPGCGSYDTFSECVDTDSGEWLWERQHYECGECGTTWNFWLGYKPAEISDVEIEYPDKNDINHYIYNITP